MIHTLRRFFIHIPSVSVAVVFLSMSMLFGSWIARIPEVQHTLGLSESKLGFALLGMSLGGMLGTSAAGILLQRLGTAPGTLAGVLLLCLSYLSPAFAWNTWSLMAALLLIGIATGFTNVAMNGLAANIERQEGIRILSTCHGMFSLGGMLGAGLSGLTAAIGVSLLAHMSGLVFMLVLLQIWLKPVLLSIPEVQAGNRRATPWRKAPAGLYLLAFIGFCVMLAEGAIADWSAVYLSAELRSGPALAAMGFAGFSLAMALGRFGGDTLARRLGAAQLVRMGIWLGSAGLLLAIIAPCAGLALMGFTLAGAGFSTIVPILFSNAARVFPEHPGGGIAIIAAGGIVGFLIGPPFIGFLAEWVGLRWALGTVLMLCVLAAILAGRSKNHPNG